jgi:hypothetical protein
LAAVDGVRWHCSSIDSRLHSEGSVGRQAGRESDAIHRWRRMASLD